MPRRTRGAAVERIGLYGGTFDPPHHGHLAIAEWARDQLALDRVLFVPSGMPPHKLGRVRSSAGHRLAMTRLAVRGNPAFVVSTIEARAARPSYTIDTLATLVARDPGASWFLIVGDDSLREFATWRRPDDIAALATIAVAGRPPASGRAPVLPRARWRDAVVPLDNPWIDLSSSALRRRARDGRSLRYLVPDAVARYVARHRLYAGEP
jgi:nicotinate-nucleotide adenylyltransferase